METTQLKIFHFFLSLSDIDYVLLINVFDVPNRNVIRMHNSKPRFKSKCCATDVSLAPLNHVIHKQIKYRDNMCSALLRCLSCEYMYLLRVVSSYERVFGN